MDTIKLPLKYRFPQIDVKNPKYGFIYKKYLTTFFGDTNGNILYKKYVTYIKNLYSENIMNDSLDIIQGKCDTKNLAIYYLTNLDGNCLFETILKTGLFGNLCIEELRHGIAFIMMLYKDTKNFFPNEENSLSELFDILNSGEAEIKYVIDDKTKKLVNYTYKVMCTDISSMTSWSRLPTEIILMVLSFIYKIKFVIINDKDSEYESVINVWDNTIIPDTEIKTVYLGHIYEYHYVAIKEKEEEVGILHYTNSLNIIKKFIDSIEESVYNCIKENHPQLLK